MMTKKRSAQETTVGRVDEDVLEFTAGEDLRLDLHLVQVDCIGTAAHVTMLSKMPVKPRLFSAGEVTRIKKQLVEIMREASRGRFKISRKDQDVHLAVERVLTATIGDLGKKVHTGRSRNDQVAVDLRLYAREQLLSCISEATDLAGVLLGFARKHHAVPMVGRTHMQPAMPSTVGLWASSFTEGLLDDIALLIGAYDHNDKCPLGSAAGYGVPLPVDRQLVSDLLGFSAPCHNVLYAGNSRGKVESVILSALNQVMLTLSRLAQDLMIFTMPEFGYFRLPPGFCTGSSIMPQKQNPDVCELIRARASRVQAMMVTAMDLIRNAPSGYNRDLQDAKGAFMDGLSITRRSLRIMAAMMSETEVNRKALVSGFTPDVFATDRALELVGEGMPFRDAYHHVKNHLDELKNVNPAAAAAKKSHLGAPGGLDFAQFTSRVREAATFAKQEEAAHRKAITKLLGTPYPLG